MSVKLNKSEEPRAKAERLIHEAVEILAQQPSEIEKHPETDLERYGDTFQKMLVNERRIMLVTNVIAGFGALTGGLLLGSSFLGPFGAGIGAAAALIAGYFSGRNDYADYKKIMPTDDGKMRADDADAKAKS